MANARSIPSIDRLRSHPDVVDLEARYGPTATVEALRAGAAVVRETLGSAESSDAEETSATRIVALAGERLRSAFRRSLVPVINATGVIVHTNLGRAPLSASALDQVSRVARGYSSLEYNLETGGRGRRDLHAEALLCRLTGAEAAVVVNNNAAATLLMLAALAAGREVVVSRGELVEIGGGFRVPDIMTQSGARLREVGTTNRTRAADYAAAISERTALILRVHPSNFRIEGFTERPALADLVTLGRRLGVPVAEDLGSGLLDSRPSHPLAGSEPSVRARIAAGVDVCSFSGDKMLGGPQAGIVVGRAPLVDQLRHHPLMRALRVDKMTYAALEATLVEYATDRSSTTVPVQHMLAMSPDSIRSRADSLAARVRTKERRLTAEVVAGTSAAGGGSAPGVELPTWLVSISHGDLSCHAIAARLRASHPPVVARIESDRVLLDLRTVPPDLDADLTEALKRLTV
jgi:L-seryl-tRNA(Ser) seleniumtransferase